MDTDLKTLIVNMYRSYSSVYHSEASQWTPLQQDCIHKLCGYLTDDNPAAVDLATRHLHQFKEPFIWENLAAAYPRLENSTTKKSMLGYAEMNPLHNSRAVFVLAAGDSDKDIRNRAVNGVCNMFKRTKDQELTLLAKEMLGKIEDESERREYLALMTTAGITAGQDDE